MLAVERQALGAFDGESLCAQVAWPTLCLAGGEDTLTLPREVAAIVTNELTISTIGIGAGVLVVAGAAAGGGGGGARARPRASLALAASKQPRSSQLKPWPAA